MTVISEGQTLAAGSSWRGQTTAVTEKARGAGRAVSHGRPMGRGIDTPQRARRRHRWPLGTVKTWTRWGVVLHNTPQLTSVHTIRVYIIRTQVFSLITWWAAVTCGLARQRLESARATDGRFSTAVWACMSWRALVSCDIVSPNSESNLVQTGYADKNQVNVKQKDIICVTMKTRVSLFVYLKKRGSRFNTKCPDYDANILESFDSNWRPFHSWILELAERLTDQSWKGREGNYAFWRISSHAYYISGGVTLILKLPPWWMDGMVC